MNFSKKVIVVTGGNRGIGYGIIETFCKSITSDKSNKAIIMAARRKEEGIKALDKLKSEYPLAKENLFFHELDVTHEHSIKRFKMEMLKHFGHLNILYNNAAVLHRNPPPEKHEREKEIMTVFNTNVWGLINLTEEMLPCIQSGGQVVNMSSILGRMRFSKTLIDKFNHENLTVDELHHLFKEYKEAYINNNLVKTGWDDKSHHYGSYGISKVFVNAYTRILDRRFKRKDANVKVNAVSPGWTKTEMGGKEAPRNYLKGAETPAWLESFPEVKNDELSGNFYEDKQKISWI